MRVLVCNRSDAASRNIRDALLHMDAWEQSNRSFRGRPVWSRSEAILVEVEGPTIHDEALDGDLKSTGLPIRDVWFLSKHAAASGQPSLTVHPIGNPGEAKFGGRAGQLPPAAPRDMGALLRRLAVRAKEAQLPHQVTYEGTHHGPWMSFPSLFVEIGSEAKWYEDPESGKVLALAIVDVLEGLGTSPGPVLVGVGGGHYHPRATDLARSGQADFGHLLSAHAVESVAEGDPSLLVRAVEATPGCQGVYVHAKGLKGPQRQKVLGWLEKAGIERVRLGEGE